MTNQEQGRQITMRMLAAGRRPAPSSQTLQSRPVHPIKKPPSKERHWGH
jgi:hypothetical protein